LTSDRAYADCFRRPLRTRVDIHADVDEELDALLSDRIEALVARGMSYENARQEAIHRLASSLEGARRDLRASAEQRERGLRFIDWVDSVKQDAQYAARGLLRRPTFTTVAVVTLAIGIGGTTAIFSAVNALLLRPLPYARPDELMKINLVVPPRDAQPANDQMEWSYPKSVAFRQRQTVFSNLAVYMAAQFTVGSTDVERGA
jgi:hypothetical protein